uniref:EF-hand domain-containing protein n=1 Tax=Chromera velia CCMP2878 TaxID=1169474 RepID=A0A0G4H9J8_9ALVE|eukprot:Cvel_6006.t1-p1 / transcript=Cvel_6006.t1 / gene=Cvel_6006 / organism=Chromera_velia_CCMP2878 / gene_product=hypothetical protein / transcript_product=hypothetical protein / location=Cvel_scaffold287:91143-96429(+) / protein_length=634 / sequence_SO=supercontig / SO=protein_coding / is_pseudo=false
MMHLQSDRAIVSCKSPDGQNERKLGLVGLLTNDPVLYSGGAPFGGASIECPWDTLELYKKKLEEEDGVDLVLPLCHLYEFQDERTCRDFDFPLILSGHDHHVVNRDWHGTRLVKPGCDARKAAVIDICWRDAQCPQPEIKLEIVDVCSFAPNAEVQKVVDESSLVLKSLRDTQLTAIPDRFRPLSSVGARSGPVSVGTFLCTELLEGAARYSPELCLLAGGNMRGGMEYEEAEVFTLETLQSEIHSHVNLAVVRLPGWLISSAMRESRKEMGSVWCLLQCDEGVQVGDDGSVVGIKGERLEKEREYSVLCVPSELDAVSGPPSLASFFSKEENKERLQIRDDFHMNAQVLLLKLWASRVWNEIWMRLDADHDGTLSPEDLGAIDRDGDFRVSAEEVLRFMSDKMGFKTCPEHRDNVQRRRETADPELEPPKKEACCWRLRHLGVRGIRLFSPMLAKNALHATLINFLKIASEYVDISTDIAAGIFFLRAKTDLPYNVHLAGCYGVVAFAVLDMLPLAGKYAFPANMLSQSAILWIYGVSAFCEVVILVASIVLTVGFWNYLSEDTGGKVFVILDVTSTAFGILIAFATMIVNGIDRKLQAALQQWKVVLKDTNGNMGLRVALLGAHALRDGKQY